MGVCCPCPYPCRPCPGGVGSCPAHPAAVGGARATPLAVVGKLPPFSPALLAWLLVLTGDGVDAVDNHCNTPVTAFFAFLTTSVGLNCAISVTKACTIGFFSLSFASLSFAFWMAQVRQDPRLCTALSHPCGVLDEPLHRPFAFWAWGGRLFGRCCCTRSTRKRASALWFTMASVGASSKR